MENENKKCSIAKQTMHDCKILYCQKDLPMTQSCMCWGWEIDDGWQKRVQELSYALETLNVLFYDKYKVRIQAEQVKEKFGTLHFYFSVICDNYKLFGRIIKKIISFHENRCNRDFYGIKVVLDKRGYSTTETEELTKEKFDEYSASKCHGTIYEKDGRYFRSYELWHHPKCHRVVTKHKIQHKMFSTASKLLNRLLFKFGIYELSDEQIVIKEHLWNQAQKLIDTAEDDCYKICSKCGSEIGTKHSPRCQTTDWIEYLCTKCADKTNYVYYKNDELWQSGKKIEKCNERTGIDEDKN